MFLLLLLALSDRLGGKATTYQAVRISGTGSMCHIFGLKVVVMCHPKVVVMCHPKVVVMCRG
jgi:hypothetical protein